MVYVFTYLVVWVVFEDEIELKAYRWYYRRAYSSDSLAQLTRALVYNHPEVPGSNPGCAISFTDYHL